MSNAIQDAQTLLAALKDERRAAIAADARNPTGRMRGGIAALQAEITAVEVAMADEQRQREEYLERKRQKASSSPAP